MPRIYGYLRVALGDAHEAEDATQEVMARALASAETFDARETPFRVWLFRVAPNHAIDHRRKHSRTNVVPPASLADDPLRNGCAGSIEEGGVSFLGDPELLGLIKRLPDNLRHVLVLRFVLGCVRDACAGRTNRSRSPPPRGPRPPETLDRCLGARIAATPAAPAPLPRDGCGELVAHDSAQVGQWR